MFLKRVELSGFKSFADKTELEFVQGITAVVGPNGSGKSNISDSIRWVLGEQSAKSLRGGKMEDIIFAGSDARKAVNYAEVSLTLDNHDEALKLDFSEVTVTRRVHRSGDSEYFINKQGCRLKDITELFMDTGIGKEAYSIIGQGRIEEILSTRSEDRRGIFEEASGIVKYKSRKKDAGRKLEDTEQNLLRIHDLVSELEDQIEPLREQSSKAVQFKQLKEELKTSEISMYVHQIEQIHESWAEANERLNILQTEQLELSTVVSKHDAHLEQHRSETRRLELELDELQTSLLSISAELEKSEGQGEVLKERSKYLVQNRLQLLQMVEVGEKRIEERRTEQTGYRDKYNAISSELNRLQSTLRSEEERLLGVTGGTSSDTEEKLRGDLLDKLNQSAQARNEIRYMEQQMESAQRRMSRLNDDHGRLAEQQKKLETRKKDLSAKLTDCIASLSESKNAYVAASQSIQSKQELLETAQSTIRKWEQKTDALVSRKDTMTEMQNDFDGFMHGVKEVLKARNRENGLRGVLGAVAELIKVPARIELAVETALGGALQHVVMEGESSAREAIAFLKRRQLGRATFLPLDVIKERYIPESEHRGLQGASGFVGVGAELVSSEPEYRNIVGNLLGNVIIAETLEDANRIAAKCQYRYRVVTLEGDIVNAGGSMTGGSMQKKNTSLLGRQRQIDELIQEIHKSQEQISQLQAQIARMKQEIIGETTQLEQSREAGEQARIIEQQLLAELKQLEGELTQLAPQLELHSQDRGQHEAEVKEYRARKKDLEQSLIVLQSEEQQVQQAIRDAELSRKASESAKDELQAYMTDLKVQVATLTQEKQSLQDQLKRITSELQQQDQELELNRSQLEQVAEDIEENQQQAVRQTEDVNTYKIRKKQCADQLEFKRAERAGWLKRLEEGENETREQRVQLKQVEEQLRQTEVKVNRLDVELENLLRKLSEDYELSYELAKERYPVPEDVSGVQQIVRDLRRTIGALGEVNLGAIEEFQRVHERYEFLNVQKNDLIEAKTALYQVIREMDEEMSKRFRSSFDAIRSHFVVVFAKLFGGGRADLILSEPGNLLETGIDIIAQPPGKKLQNLQLLSGGERALTAIALLFAILLVKPVPFCVLDEVEAALDEANVARFAQYLREFSELTQFIVVTHRKGTMEEADVLYGVTMEEGGVSKLVSVKLDDEAAVSA
ncbi:chromosome segregation protein SMC [Paenibacillus swuensis]|uniref:Chromosome partition protein Smc n=1 Tax=Paenibacillus swuensis TaxID=1178515 RepID=A0A172TKE3_9BACL|nr:chromosome segregation protein SMC [Paenibacillus swuensis]ANE47511.1 chromosome segregation protein SMC [Paenibacillus swuensis]